MALIEQVSYDIHTYLRKNLKADVKIIILLLLMRGGEIST